MRYIWRKISVGFGKETTRGTAATASAWFPKTSIDFEEKFENVVQEGSVWVIVDSNDSFNTKRWAEGSIEGDLQIENSGLLFLSLLGQVASTETAGTGAYDHVYTLANTNQHQSLTITTAEDNWDFQFSLGMIDELKISGAQGEIAKVSVTFKSKAWVTTTATTDFIDTDKTLLTRHGEFQIDWSVIPFKSFEISFKKNLLEDFAGNSIDVHDILNQQFEITGSVEFDYDANTFKDYALNNEKKPISLVIQDPNTTIWVSNNPTLSITLNKVSFTSWDRNKGNDEIVNQVLEFKGHYDLTSDSIGSILLRNTTASY